MYPGEDGDLCEILSVVRVWIFSGTTYYGKMTCQVFLSLKQLLQCKKSDLCNACANNNNNKKKKIR